MSADDSWLDMQWRELRRRMVTRLKEQDADLAPSTMRLTTEVYTDPARLDAERSGVFMRVPLFAGLSSELPAPGSVLLFDAAGPGIVIVRQQDGTLGAFLNFCPHRGARLVEDARSRDSFVCPFHAWRFDTRGSLLSRPLDQAFCEHEAPPALRAVPVAEKYGLVFVRVTPGAEPIDVGEWLGPIAPLLEAFELGGARHVRTEPVSVRANWKLAVDISCEGYHVPMVHRHTLSPRLAPYLTIHDSFGPHHRFCSPNRALAGCIARPESEWPTSHYSAVHYLFPNTVLTYSDAIDGEVPVLAINRSFPGRHVDQALVLYSTYKPAPARAQPDEGFVALHEAVVGINRSEDLPMVEAVWRNYASLPAPLPIVFGRNEMILQRYHADVAAAAGMPVEP